MAIGSARLSAAMPMPPRSRARRISSVAYALEEIASELKIASAFFLESRSPSSSAEASGRPKRSRRRSWLRGAPGAQLLVRLGPRLQGARGRVAEVLALRPLDADTPIPGLLAGQAAGRGRPAGMGLGRRDVASWLVRVGHRPSARRSASRPAAAARGWPIALPRWDRRPDATPPRPRPCPSASRRRAGLRHAAGRRCRD